MKITQSQLSGKFSISNLTESDMVALYHVATEPMKSKIALALIESTDEDECENEYGYGATEFWRNVGIEV